MDKETEKENMAMGGEAPALQGGREGAFGRRGETVRAGAGLLRLADESTAGELRRRIRWLGVQMAMLAVLQGLTVVYVLWRFSVR